MDVEQVATVVVAVDPVAAGGLVAHLLRVAEEPARRALCGAARDGLFVLDLDWAVLPGGRRCPRCHTSWAGVPVGS